MDFFSLTVLHMKLRRKTKRVLITGFGPYEGVPHNLSWEGVACMDKYKIERDNNIMLLKTEIGVRYREVDFIVPALWRAFLPHLAIHVGVHPLAKTFRLETNARNYGYENQDIGMQMPSSSGIVSGVCPKITTIFDVTQICEEFNKNPPAPKLKAEVSNDAGQYLCEYIYYTSLYQGPTLFVHIPPDKYSEDEIACGLQRILEICLKHS